MIFPRRADGRETSSAAVARSIFGQWLKFLADTAQAGPTLAAPTVTAFVSKLRANKCADLSILSALRTLNTVQRRLDQLRATRPVPSFAADDAVVAGPGFADDGTTIMRSSQVPSSDAISSSPGSTA
jgi:hypothetical protein